MFDPMSAEALREARDGVVFGAIAECARLEAIATAGRWRAIAELTVRRCGGGDRALWSCDEWDAAAAEVSAALGISHGRALAEMDIAIALRNRLPKVAALLAAGECSARLVAVAVARTALVDPSAIGSVDEAIAHRAHRWGGLSRYKLEQAVDAWVDRFDPGALRQTQSRARGREVVIGGRDPGSGTAALWGRLLGSDAALLDRRLTAMATAVCADDPRTLAQRRADALGALAAGSDRLACGCEDPQCPAAGRDPRAAAIVVHVLADGEAVTARPDPAMSGEDTLSGPQTSPGRTRAGAQPPQSQCRPGVAVILGGGAIPSPLLASLIAAGAAVRPLNTPPGMTEPGYRPSARLAEFIRMRDMTCRFPGCEVPADRCDIDHTIPWPYGPTHPTNLHLKCRKHHLLTTFWTGAGGWSQIQHPDATLVWTSPTGATHISHPGSRLLFPTWNTDTGPLPPAAFPRPGDSPGRTLMMPRRRRTRASDRAAGIRAERALNHAHVTERNRPPPF